MLSIRFARGAAAALSLALVALGSSANAQATVTADYAPSCGPGTPCATVRFTLANTSSSTLLFNTFTLTSSGSPFLFDPTTGGFATYQAEDSVGPFSGFGGVNVGGTSFAIDFLGGSGFQFEIGAGMSGYVEAALAQTPMLTPRAFTFAATVDGSTAPIVGSVGVVSAVPEPATFALLAGGLALVGGVAARRRRV